MDNTCLLYTSYEFQVSNPVVIYKEIDGEKCEPIERLTVDIPEEYTGAVMDQVINRMGNMTNMTPTAQNYTRLEFLIPSRGLIGFRKMCIRDRSGSDGVLFKGRAAGDK